MTNFIKNKQTNKFLAVSVDSSDSLNSSLKQEVKFKNSPDNSQLQGPFCIRETSIEPSVYSELHPYFITGFTDGCEAGNFYIRVSKAPNKKEDKDGGNISELSEGKFGNMKRKNNNDDGKFNLFSVIVLGVLKGVFKTNLGVLNYLRAAALSMVKVILLKVYLKDAYIIGPSLARDWTRNNELKLDN